MELINLVQSCISSKMMGVFRQDFLATGQHEILQDMLHIFCYFKKIFVLFIFIKVEISGIFIILSAKFL